ncbi:hypothetical protein B0T26DRAFT_516818 [Lasiosphaeria miniovina]|uniref:Uncharacterized protein n=1 Tax=Lasiosphaeria miniovina TaxID=1954250 RepID=A0AA39ZUL2_9PEZI|nr:uncharacterized protein B0T26DRAFT_516818 [Lasiosphaeria miniovina]KAK0703868.1 hypothetical protein B0T26DRAFT_516818 [Lasiosphaeria miniovina]
MHWLLTSAQVVILFLDRAPGGAYVDDSVRTPYFSEASMHSIYCMCLGKRAPESRVVSSRGLVNGLAAQALTASFEVRVGAMAVLGSFSFPITRR